MIHAVLPMLTALDHYPNSDNVDYSYYSYYSYYYGHHLDVVLAIVHPT
jgi:tetrahydromethanopterin S-methyltransferase subunit B